MKLKGFNGLTHLFLAIRVPGEVRVMENASITVEIDYDVEAEYERIKVDFEIIELTKSPLRMTISAHRKLKFLIYFERRFRQNEYLSWKNKRMTGMKVTWKYNQNVEQKSIFKKSNKDFIELANMLEAVHSESYLWRIIKAAKVDWYIEREDSSSRYPAISLGNFRYLCILNFLKKI